LVFCPFAWDINFLKLDWATCLLGKCSTTYAMS
jgi:hypothetical protein